MALLGPPAWSAGENAAPDDAERHRADFITAGMLDPEAPAMRRAELAAGLEAYAHERGDPVALYVVGSLYRLGSEASPTSPYPRDLDKARKYLTRAALKGQLGAMGKLALFEYEERNRFEANVWAQLHAYYAAEFRRSQRPGRDKDPVGVAGILALVQEGFPKGDVPKLEERVGMMIRSYDKAIRAGAGRIAEQRERSPLRNARADRCNIPRGQLQQSRARRPTYFAGGAEYYISFADDGSAARVWLLDVWPDTRRERGLRTCAGRYRVEATEAIAGKGLVALLPIVLDDLGVKLRSGGD